MKQLGNEIVSYPILVWEEGVRVLHSGKFSYSAHALAASVSASTLQGRDGPTMTQGTEAIPRGLVPTGKDSWLLYGRC